jgi:acyl-Coa thioesterase superfamily protein/acyl-CoA thioesterase superfamily protein
MPPTLFSAATALVATAPGCFDAAVDAEWTIGGKPNGGYLLAMLGRAAAAVAPHGHVIAASAHYLHSPEPGPVTVEVAVLRAGRSASQVRARMSQGEQLCIEALLTMSVLQPDGAAYWDRGLPTPGDVDFDESIRIPSRTPTGTPVAIMDQVDLRIEPSSLAFAAGQPSGRGELRGWLALAGGESFDPSSLLYAVDAFPPATFDIEPSGWVPTLELTVYVRALPAPGPVRVLHRAQLIDGQRVDEACYVWDGTGRLVAQGTQLAGIRLGSR